MRTMPTAPTDTIAAIATAAGEAGVGIVRLSGPNCSAIALALLGRAPRPRHAHYAGFRAADGELLDRGLLLYFPGPNSFTGEDVLELQGHGGRVVLNRVLDRLLELGARRARPGEFSERAFLNGKLDLAQAEAIADLISAHSEASARAAMRSLEGEFSRSVEQLVENVTRLRVHVEAAIDFPDEEIDFLADSAIADQLAGAQQQLDQLFTAARRGAKLRDGLHAVIVGPPNAGKSSLLNALAGSERAIVTEQAGTTRDVLRETIRIDDLELVLADTAGLREDSSDAIEREGMRRARAEREAADLLLLVLEAGDAQAEAMLRAEFADHPHRLWIHNKADLHGRAEARSERDGELHLTLSVREASGIDLLRRTLSEQVVKDTGGSGSFSARQRHVDALRSAFEQLELAARHLQQRQGELMAEDLRQCQHHLGEITGAIDADALLGRIFSSFCIGK